MSVSLKFRYQDEVRRIGSPRDAQFEAVKDSIVPSLFPHLGPHFELKYKDDDGDMITLSSTGDFQEALQQLTKSCLVIYVKQTSCAAPQKAAPAPKKKKAVSKKKGAPSKKRNVPRKKRCKAAKSEASPQVYPVWESIFANVKRWTEEIQRENEGVELREFLGTQVPDPVPAPGATRQEQFDVSNVLETVSAYVDQMTFLARVASFVEQFKKGTVNGDKVRRFLEVNGGNLSKFVRANVSADRARELAKGLVSHARNAGVVDRYLEVLDWIVPKAEEWLVRNQAAVVGSLEEWAKRYPEFAPIVHAVRVCIEDHSGDVNQTTEKKLDADDHDAFPSSDVEWELAPAPHSAEFVKDVTLLDDTQIEFGHEGDLVKTWRVRNNGLYLWQRGVHLVRSRQAIPTASVYEFPERVEVAQASAGAEQDISVNLSVPSTPGRYVAHYRLCRADGQCFGHEIWVDFTVKGQYGDELSILLNCGFASDICVAALAGAEGNVEVALNMIMDADAQLDAESDGE